MSYSVREAARLLRVPPNRVHGLVRAGLLDDARRGERGEVRVSFRDLVLLRTVTGLSGQLPTRRLHRALGRLRERLPRGKALSQMRLWALGNDLVVRDERGVYDPLSGQELLDFEAPAPEEEEVRVLEAPPRIDRDAVAEPWHEALRLEGTDRAQAVLAYIRVLEIDAEHVGAHINLGRLLHESGDAAAAELHYRAALASEPANATAAFNLGVALEDQEEAEEALGAYETAIDVDPNLADAYFNASRVCETLGWREEALDYLARYRRLVIRSV